MLTDEQIATIHRLHFVENWTLRKIARHFHIGRRTIAKYLANPAPAAVHRSRSSKLDPYKPLIQDWLQQDPTVTATVIEQRLRQLGFAGGHTIDSAALQQLAAGFAGH